MVTQLDRTTLAVLEGLARQHIATYVTVQNEREAIEWADRGERLADAVESFRRLVKPDAVAAAIRRGMAR